MNNRTIDINSHGNRLNVNKFISHVIVISMLFLLPEFLMGYAMSAGGKGGSGGPHWHMYAKSLIFIAVFYVEYYYVIGRTLSPKVRLWRFLVYNILLLIAALGISYVIWYYFAYLPRIADSAAHPIRNPEKFRLMFVSSMVRDGVMVILTLGLAVAMRLSDHWSALERQRRDIAAAQKSSELQNLKSQLNPHFLFNTLNSIYALIEISPAEAQAAVHELSQMLRYMLYETPSQVTLRQETDFTCNYISLMQLRLRPGVVKTNIDIEDMADAPIAPLLFISLIENAFKYGNTGSDNDLISIDITARGGRIECRTYNRFNPSTLVDRPGGIGIANLRRRLVLIYGQNAALTTTIDGDSFTSQLIINVTHD